MPTLKYKNGSNWVNFIDVMYPVGSVYTAYTSTSPADRFGGTWTPITGRFPYYNAGNSTGGSNTHTHTYGIYFNSWYGQVCGTDAASLCSAVYDGQTLTDSLTLGVRVGTNETRRNTALQTSSVMQSNMGKCLVEGVTTEESNMPAYQTLYAWRRTA